MRTRRIIREKRARAARWSEEKDTKEEVQDWTDAEDGADDGVGREVGEHRHPWGGEVASVWRRDSIGIAVTLAW